MYAAIDKVCTRIEKTLRRHKDKIKTHRVKKNIKTTEFIEQDMIEERGQL